MKSHLGLATAILPEGIYLPFIKGIKFLFLATIWNHSDTSSVLSRLGRWFGGYGEAAYQAPN